MKSFYPWLFTILFTKGILYSSKCESSLTGECPNVTVCYKVKGPFFGLQNPQKILGITPVDPLNSITEEISVLQNMSGLRISISHKVKHTKFLEDKSKPLVLLRLNHANIYYVSECLRIV